MSAGILPFVDNQKEIVSEIVSIKGKGVLLLFDGWDGLPEEQQRPYKVTVSYSH